ncbi:MAG TPA: SAM-dependent chlorinase/fluorinase [Ktedonobacterales bacterium]
MAPPILPPPADVPLRSFTPPPIAMLTDFGTRDGYPGIMRGVILGIAPASPVVDLTHEIPPQDIASGAWVLSTAWRYFPAGSIFLAVVDPGVGSARRALALRVGGRLFVGPDNGLASLVTAQTPIEEAVVLDNPRYQLPHPSATFHGRDIFAPAAAHLAAGVPLVALGSPLAPQALVTIALPAPRWEGEALAGQVLHVDTFGNLITSFAGPLADALLSLPGVSITLGGATISDRAATFAAGPDATPFALRDSSGHLAIAVRNGSAAAQLGVARGAEVRAHGMSRGMAG